MSNSAVAVPPRAIIGTVSRADAGPGSGRVSSGDRRVYGTHTARSDSLVRHVEAIWTSEQAARTHAAKRSTHPGVAHASVTVWKMAIGHPTQNILCLITTRIVAGHRRMISSTVISGSIEVGFIGAILPKTVI